MQKSIVCLDFAKTTFLSIILFSACKFLVCCVEFGCFCGLLIVIGVDLFVVY